MREQKNNTSDITGMVFGMLTTIERVSTLRPGRPSGPAAWRCLCECGNHTVRRKCDLLSGKSWNCGCKKRPYRKGKDTPETDESLSPTDYVNPITPDQRAELLRAAQPRKLRMTDAELIRLRRLNGG